MGKGKLAPVTGPFETELTYLKQHPIQWHSVALQVGILGDRKAQPKYDPSRISFKYHQSKQIPNIQVAHPRDAPSITTFGVG